MFELVLSEPDGFLGPALLERCWSDLFWLDLCLCMLFASGACPRDGVPLVNVTGLPGEGGAL